MTSQTKDLLKPDWLGLVIDSRQLFDALQDGWLRPIPPRIGVPIGVGTFVRERSEAAGNRIPVWVRLDTGKLPRLDVNVLRENRWCSLPHSLVTTSDRLVFWPGVVPTFAILDLGVASEEQRARLLSMARRASNVSLPDILTPDDADYPFEEMPLTLAPPSETPPGIVIPTAEDSIRGAMTMAVWAIPRMDPWMDVLTASLSSTTKRLEAAARAVQASWWRYPPWSRTVQWHESTGQNAQQCLWIAAMDVFGSHVDMRPSEAADRITQAALRGNDCAKARQVIKSWCRSTRQVLRADAVIRREDWRQMPVGLAIQLVLARPEPAEFKTWLCDDMPPAPSVAWSAATLCGLFHGYRRLETGFRGSLSQQEAIAVQALRACSEKHVPEWPDLTNDEPRWRKESGTFVLTWGGRDFAGKREKKRGQWYASNLDDPAVQREAVAVAKHFDWPCVSRVVTMGAGRRPWDGPGAMESDETAVKVRGRIRLRLSPSDQVQEEVDQRSFLRLVATEPGRIPAPPVSALEQSPDGIPGFNLVPDFLTAAEEEDILAEIDRSPWSSELQRRVQHYGWRYDYKSKQVDPTMRVGPLPEWANSLAQRLFESGHVPERPDQVIVNEYVQNQGIAPHIDSPSSFADGIAMISLLETWEMEFRNRGANAKVLRRLERRSAAVLTGEARYEWRHGLPHRKSEPANKPGNGKPRRIPRGRRISLTFRKVIGDDSRPADSSSPT